MLTNGHGSTRLESSLEKPIRLTRGRFANEDNTYLIVKLGYSKLTNRHDSHGSTRIDISEVDPFHRKSIRKRFVM